MLKNHQITPLNLVKQNCFFVYKQKTFPNPLNQSITIILTLTIVIIDNQFDLLKLHIYSLYVVYVCFPVSSMKIFAKKRM